jgi:small conductance mechanosensitive channel
VRSPLPPQTAPADSAQAPAEGGLAGPFGNLLQRTAPDTAAVADTTQSFSIGEINNAIGRAISLILQGRFDEMYQLLYANALDLIGLVLGGGIQALVAFAVLYLAYRLVGSALDRLLQRSSRIDPGLRGLLENGYRVVALVFIFLIVIGQLGFNVTVLLGSIGIAGIALGFAARDSLENFISGVTILTDKPFKVGDYIVVDGEYGEVMEITLRSTRIRTVRNEIMVLPNTQMITQRVTNHTKQNTVRVDIEFGIAYKEYPAEAREVLLELPKGDDRILSTPEPSVIVTAMADSSVNMVLRFYLSDPTKEVPVRWEYTEKVREALREADIEIPFPHQQLFIDEAKAFEGTPLLERSNGSDASSGEVSDGE